MFDWMKGPEDRRAELNYLGNSGITQKCKKALQIAVEGLGTPDEVILIRNGEARAFLLVVDEREDETIIMPGFAEGYSGEAPDGYSWAISYLESKGVVRIMPRDVPDVMMKRLENRDLTVDDVKRLRGYS